MLVLKLNSGIVLAAVLKLSSMRCCDLVWENFQTQVGPLLIFCIIHWGCMWKAYGSADYKAKLITLWKHTSLAKGLIKWGDERVTAVAPWKSLWNLQCPIRSSQAPSLRARQYLSSCLLSQCEECNQMQMPPCVCSILTHTFTVVGFNSIAGFCSLDTV